MKLHITRLLTLTLICGLLSGCVISRSTTLEESGRKIGESTLETLENNVTTKKWVQTVLKEPTRKDIISETTEIWVYEYRLKEQKNVGVIVLLASQKEKIESQLVYLEFNEGILTKHWTEE